MLSANTPFANAANRRPHVLPQCPGKASSDKHISATVWCLKIRSPVAGEPLMTEATIAHVQGVVAEKGTDAWWQLPLEELLPGELRDQAPRLKKGEDTMVRTVCLGSCSLKHSGVVAIRESTVDIDNIESTPQNSMSDAGCVLRTALWNIMRGALPEIHHSRQQQC